MRCSDTVQSSTSPLIKLIPLVTKLAIALTEVLFSASSRRLKTLFLNSFRQVCGLPNIGLSLNSELLEASE
ncbi:MAG: hypothetical protein SWZ49_08205 [Cyanobacteriota bacterium]|nr:hypothetical protein [Cyanobacteriota bacterium]